MLVSGQCPLASVYEYLSGDEAIPIRSSFKNNFRDRLKALKNNTTRILFASTRDLEKQLRSTSLGLVDFSELAVARIRDTYDLRLIK